VAAFLEPEVLIVDEALSVGDAKMEAGLLCLLEGSRACCGRLSPHPTKPE
jgi:hypothetical protein